MKFTTIIIFTLFFTFLMITCCKEDIIKQEETNSINCESLRHGFLTKNYAIVKPIIDSICKEYPPLPTATDTLGHQLNTSNLITQLNENCSDLKIELKCYGCLESLPVQSSFIVKIDSNGFKIERHFSLYVPEGKAMYFNN